MFVPWSNAPDQAEMGMSAQDLKTIIPKISPLSGMFEGSFSDESGVIKDGMYASDSDENDYSETIVYGIGGSRVTQFYWASTKNAAFADVVDIRRQLSKMHGDSKVGYKARVTKDGIAKITTEVFTVNNTDLVISLSSALGSTEIAILDTSDPKVDLDELYFTFEKQRERLRTDLLRLTKNTPKDESAAESLDVLKEAIAANAKEESRDQPNQESSSSQTPDIVPAETKQSEEKGINAVVENSSGWGSKYAVVVLVSAIIFLCAFLVIRRAKRKG
jgi:hypothetical protein